jgi:hypothetical protein
MDKAGILEAIKKAYPGSDVFGDDVLAGLAAEALSGAGDAPADEMMPDATKTPETPAVPLAPIASAEDEAKTIEAATAAAKATADKKEIETLKARVKELEARELSGKIVNANAADRKPVTVLSFAERHRTERNARLGASAQ